jgi:hypothetical protein
MQYNFAIEFPVRIRSRFGPLELKEQKWHFSEEEGKNKDSWKVELGPIWGTWAATKAKTMFPGKVGCVQLQFTIGANWYFTENRIWSNSFANKFVDLKEKSY